MTYAPFTGEIRQFAIEFVPVDWALCDGRLMSISQNAELFFLIGNRYGGDGKFIFALPNIPQQPGDKYLMAICLRGAQGSYEYSEPDKIILERLKGG